MRIYVIQSRSGSRVIDNAGRVMVFGTTTGAERHIARIKPEMPSKDLPLRIVSEQRGERYDSLSGAPFPV